MDRLDRVLGGMFGVACGDALGATLEFIPREEGEKKYGFHRDITGGGVLSLLPGEVTDDTSMTIALARGILENPEDPRENIGKYFMEWYDTKPRDIGLTINYALTHYREHGNWDRASRYAHEAMNGKSAGNGTLMRCIPAGLYYRDFDKMIRVTEMQSQMTHYDRKAAKACGLYNTLVYKYLSGVDKMEAVREVLYENFDYEGVLKLEKRRLRPSGYVVDSLICAIWCFINYDNPEDIICQAVNLYGDPDTIGAIAGGLAGVYYGYESLPVRWRDAILVKKTLYDLAVRLNG